MERQKKSWSYRIIEWLVSTQTKDKGDRATSKGGGWGVGGVMQPKKEIFLHYFFIFEKTILLGSFQV